MVVKERVFESLVRDIGCKVRCDKDRLKILECLQVTATKCGSHLLIISLKNNFLSSRKRRRLVLEWMIGRGLWFM